MLEHLPKAFLRAGLVVSLLLSCNTLDMPKAWSNSPEPTEGGGFEPAKMTDPQILNHWCDALQYPITSAWQKAKFKGKAVSCIFQVDPKGEISDIRIFKSSGSKPVDKAAIDAIKNASTGEKMARPLAAPQQIVVQFFNSQDVRLKWKRGEDLVTVGRFAGCPDPKE